MWLCWQAFMSVKHICSSSFFFALLILIICYIANISSSSANVLEACTLIFGGKAYFVRLACVRHAASVRPEPGSNSRLIFSWCSSLRLALLHCYYFFVQIYFRTLSQFRSLIYLLLASYKLETHCGWPTINFFLLTVEEIGLGHTRFFLCCFIVYVLFCCSLSFWQL